MRVSPWPDHLLSLDEWNALPEESPFWREIVDGVLILSPRPGTLHQRAVTRLAYLLDQQLPGPLSVAPQVEVVISGNPYPTVRVPDVVVTDTAFGTPLVVEVPCRGSARTDRVSKFAEYAEAGIANYWIVDLDAPVSLLRYHLIAGDYELFGEHTGTVTVELDGNPIKLDLDALVARRA